MKSNAKSPAAGQAGSRAQRGARGPAARKDLQPRATGAQRGSPAAPAMKQFAKTKAESSGRS